jgi:hypothetical protein
MSALALGALMFVGPSARARGSAPQQEWPAVRTDTLDGELFELYERADGSGFCQYLSVSDSAAPQSVPSTEKLDKLATCFPRPTREGDSIALGAGLSAPGPRAIAGRALPGSGSVDVRLRGSKAHVINNVTEGSFLLVWRGGGRARSIATRDEDLDVNAKCEVEWLLPDLPLPIDCIAPRSGG